MPAPQSSRLPPCFAHSPSALITGASSGIGAALALQLAQRGVRIFGTSRNPTDHPPPHPNISFLQLDASHPAGLQAFVQSNAPLLQSVDLLVNNAGSAAFGPFLNVPAATHDALLHLLLHAPIALCRAVLPAMLQRRNGCIINVASLAAQLPIPLMPAYNCAKAGLSAFSRSLILDLPQPPRIIDLQLGDVRTAFNQHLQSFEPIPSPSPWPALQHNLATAPLPDAIARNILAALHRDKSAVLCLGSTFQARIATLAARLLPFSSLATAIRRFYRLPTRP